MHIEKVQSTRKSLDHKSICNTRNMPTMLRQSHSLESLNSSVIARYYDRPLKLRNHLPFAVDYQNNSL